MKKGWKSFTAKHKLVQDSKWNEENRYPGTHSNNTKIYYTKEPSEGHKNNLKEEIPQVINENVIGMLLDMVNQNVQEALKNFQDNNKKKNMRKHKNK
jgi:hypothetical protein